MLRETSSSDVGALLTADVVIVGAGPSGCSAAFDLVVKGLRVLLLDRTEFPRRKTCAGGLTVKAVRALRYSIAPVIQRTVSNLSVSCRMRRPKLFTSKARSYFLQVSMLPLILMPIAWV